MLAIKYDSSVGALGSFSNAERVKVELLINRFQTCPLYLVGWVMQTDALGSHFGVSAEKARGETPTRWLTFRDDFSPPQRASCRLTTTGCWKDLVRDLSNNARRSTAIVFLYHTPPPLSRNASTKISHERRGVRPVLLR